MKTWEFTRQYSHFDHIFTYTNYTAIFLEGTKHCNFFISNHASFILQIFAAAPTSLHRSDSNIDSTLLASIEWS